MYKRDLSCSDKIWLPKNFSPWCCCYPFNFGGDNFYLLATSFSPFWTSLCSSIFSTNSVISGTLSPLMKWNIRDVHGLEMWFDLCRVQELYPLLVGTNTSSASQGGPKLFYQLHHAVTYACIEHGSTKQNKQTRIPQVLFT